MRLVERRGMGVFLLYLSMMDKALGQSTLHKQDIS